MLAAALLHALWNSIVKSAGDKFMSSARVALWTGVVSMLGRSGHADAYSRHRCRMWTASALIHVVYFLLIGRLYRNADLSVAYPLMRGLVAACRDGHCCRDAA